MRRKLDTTANIIKALTILLDLKSLSLVLLQAIAKDVHENCLEHLETLMNKNIHPVIISHKSTVVNRKLDSNDDVSIKDGIVLNRKAAPEAPVVKMNVGADSDDGTSELESHPFSLIKKLIAIATRVICLYECIYYVMYYEYYVVGKEKGSRNSCR